MNLVRAVPAVVCLAAACGGGGREWRSRLVPVPEPDLARHQEPTRAKLRDLRARVDRDVASRAATPASAAAAFGELGRVYFAHDLWTSAQASLSNAAALDAGNRRWPYLLGVIAQLEGRPDEAAGHLERALALAPGDAAALVRLGQADLDRGLRASSRRRYEQALANPATAAAAHFGLGRLAAAAGDHASAVAHFEEVRSAQPGATVVHHGLGLALRHLGRRDEAERHLARAGAVAVSFPDPIVDELSDLVVSALSYVLRGQKAQQAGDTRQALVEFRRAVEADPGLALAHYSLGTLLGHEGDVAQAIVHLQRATALDPASAEAFYNLATALFREGRTDAGMAALERAVALDPENDAARLLRAAVHRERGRMDLARSDLEAILARDPLHGEALSELAVLLAWTGRAGEADQLLRDALARRPPAGVEARVRSARAFLLGEKGDRRAAIDEYRKAIALQPDHADASLNLGTLLLRERRHAQAADAFAAVIPLQPSNARAHLGLAHARIGAGDWPRARAALEAGVRTVPDDSALASALAEVLAGSPDATVRDGTRALQLATTAYQAGGGAGAEAVGMALAELGRFEEAARFQRELLEQARKGGAPAALQSRLAKNLERYQRGQPVRIVPAR